MTIDPDNLYTYKAKIIRIIDGDTLDIELDLGLRIKIDVRIRLLSSRGGVDTSETNAADPAIGVAAKRATARTVQLVPAGSVVLVKTELDKKDSFGRLLANVLNMDGINVGDALLSEGLAAVWAKGK